jgi:hypothetical protein
MTSVDARGVLRPSCLSVVNPFFGLITLLLWLLWPWWHVRTLSLRPFPSCLLTALLCSWCGGAGTHTYQKEASHRHGQKFFQGIAVHLDSPVIINSESLHSVLQLAITMGFFLKNRNHRFVKDSKSLSWQGQAGLLDSANRRYLSTGVAIRTLAAAVPSRLAKRSK